MSFLQFRKILPGALIHEIRAIFDDRKDYMTTTLAAIKLLNDDAKKGKMPPIPPEMFAEA